MVYIMNEEMDITGIEYKILELCKKQNLTQDDIDFVNYIFQNNILNVDFDDCEFILSASFFRNYKMVELLIKNNANIHVDNNKPYRLALQNGDEKCMKLLCQQN